MKPRHLAHLAVAMLAGSVSSIAAPKPLSIGLPYDMMPDKEPWVPSRAGTNSARRKKNSSASQRQIRRNRRRAHAAGMRHAFCG